MIIQTSNVEEYPTNCKRVYRCLRYGPLVVKLEAGGTRYDMVLIPAGGVSDIEDLRHHNDGLYLIVTNFDAGMYLVEPAEADARYLAEKLRMRQGDTVHIAKFLRDMARLAEEGDEDNAP